MLNYKNDLDGQNSKTDIFYVDDRGTSNDGNDLIEFGKDGVDDSQQFDQACAKIIEFSNENNAKMISLCLRIIRNSVSNLKSSCLQHLIHYHIFEIVSQLMDHENNHIRIKAARTILIIIKNMRNVIQFFYQIPNFSALLFNVVNTCSNIDGIYFGLFSLYHFYKKYNATNPEFFSQLSIQYLDSIFQSIEKIDIDNGYIRKIYVYQCIALFYRKLCKQKINQDEYESVISFVVAIFSYTNFDSTSLFPDLFKILSNLISNDNMPIEGFFMNNFHRNAINEIIFANSISTIRSYNLFTSILNKGLQVKDLVKLSVLYSDMQSKEQMELSPEIDYEALFFSKFITYALNSIECHRIDEYEEEEDQKEDQKEGRGEDQKDDRPLIAAAATRMLTSAIRSDDDMLVINYLTSSQGNNFGFLSIIDNLCDNDSIFSLVQDSAYCLMNIIMRIDQSRFYYMNDIIYSSRIDENSKTIDRSLVLALLKIATTDDEEVVFHSLNMLINLTDISDSCGMISMMVQDYLMADGFVKLVDISDQNANPDIKTLCEQIRELYTSKIKDGN